MYDYITLKHLSFWSAHLYGCCYLVVKSFPTPWTVSQQAPLSMGCPRKDYSSGLSFPSPGGSSQPRDQTLLSCIGRWILYHRDTRKAPSICCLCACSVPVTPRLLCPWHFPEKNTGVGCHALLQGIFLTQGSKLQPLSLRSPALVGGLFTTSTTWVAQLYGTCK